MTNYPCDALHVRLRRIEIQYDIEESEYTYTRFVEVDADGSTLTAERCSDCKKVQNYQYKPRSLPAEKISPLDPDRLVGALRTITGATGTVTLTLEQFRSGSNDGKPDRPLSRLTHLLSDRPRVTIRESR